MDDIERAKKTFSTLCAYLDEVECPYEKNDEKLSISFTTAGDDLPIKIRVIVDSKKQLISLFSQIPVVVPEEKRLDLAIAVTVANNSLVDGCFDYDLSEGYIVYRMTSSFIESEIGRDLFEYLMIVSCQTVDEYNDKFLMLSKGLMSIEDFISKE